MIPYNTIYYNITYCPRRDRAGEAAAGQVAAEVRAAPARGTGREAAGAEVVVELL